MKRASSAEAHDVSKQGSRARALALLAVRALLGAAMIALVAAFTPESFDVAGVASVIVIAASLDFTSAFALRNVYLVYAPSIFIVGLHIEYPGSAGLTTDLLLYLLAFVAAYLLYGRLRAQRPSAHVSRRFDLSGPITSKIEILLWFFFAAQLVRVALLIAPYGFASFYRGQDLANRVSSFGHAGSTGVQAITGFVVTIIDIAVVALYAQHCLQARIKIKYWLLFLVIIVPAVLALERPALVYGTALLVAVYVTERRARAVYAPRVPNRARTVRQAVAVGLIVLFAVGAAVTVGELRGNRIREKVEVGGQKSTLELVLRSEFTVIVFYLDVKDHIGTLGYQYGKPIAGAFVTRFIPRSIWPDKPMTTAEYYMRQLRPKELKAGFSLAPSIFGVSYLNFGLLGTMIVVGLLGVACAFCDRGYTARDASRVPYYLILAAWIYSILRDDLSTSLACATLTLVTYFILRNLFAQLSTRQALENTPN